MAPPSLQTFGRKRFTVPINTVINGPCIATLKVQQNGVEGVGKSLSSFSAVAGDSAVAGGVAPGQELGDLKEALMEEVRKRVPGGADVGGGMADEEDATVAPVVLNCATMNLVREYQKFFPDQMAES
ncbi:hypothetical protein BDR26DRAFT_933389 [Obelidium mucronatum]|nr:hypothetical protein BDR26DRAFT_933389 [Obelidium mucronatum]